MYYIILDVIFRFDKQKVWTKLLVKKLRYFLNKIYCYAFLSYIHKTYDFKILLIEIEIIINIFFKKRFYWFVVIHTFIIQIFSDYSLVFGDNSNFI